MNPMNVRIIPRKCFKLGYRKWFTSTRKELGGVFFLSAFSRFIRLIPEKKGIRLLMRESRVGNSGFAMAVGLNDINMSKRKVKIE